MAAKAVIRDVGRVLGHFSKYYHFIALPDLRVFANAGFPYSRMADLSDT
ncbi:hypothetical protein FK521_30520, partial [Klebsiella pneumoniae]|nr:hypothetical protein [Klebsiella pneumoniae]